MGKGIWEKRVEWNEWEPRERGLEGLTAKQRLTHPSQLSMLMMKWNPFVPSSATANSNPTPCISIIHSLCHVQIPSLLRVKPTTFHIQFFYQLINAKHFIPPSARALLYFLYLSPKCYCFSGTLFLLPIKISTNHLINYSL